MNDLLHILNPSSCLSRQQLLDYLSHKLEREEVLLVEDHISSCALCSAAVDSMREGDMDEYKNAMDEIRTFVEDKISFVEQQDKKPPPALRIGRKRKWKIATMAAGILFILFSGGYLLYSYFDGLNIKNGDLAEKSPSGGENYEVLEDSSPELTTITLSEEEIARGELAKEKIEKALPPALSSTKKKNEIIASTDLAKPIDEKEAERKALPPPGIPVPRKVQEAYKQDPVPNPALSNTYHIPPDLGKMENTKKDSYEAIDKIAVNETEELNQPAIQSNDRAINKEVSGAETFQQKGKRNKTESVRQTTATKTTYDTDYKEGLYYFEQKDYEKSAELLEKALKRKKRVSNKEDIEYYLGLCYYHLGKTDKAEKLFNDLKGTKYDRQVTEWEEQIKK